MITSKYVFIILIFASFSFIGKSSTTKSILNFGEEILSNQGIVLKSNNGLYELKFDNNHLYITKGALEIWSINCKNAYKIYLNENGVIIIEDIHKKSLWTSKNISNGSKYSFLSLQDDGNLVLFSGSWIPFSDGLAIWSSGTSGL